MKELAGRMDDFFKLKQFEVLSGETGEGYKIFAENSPLYELRGFVETTIQGTQDEFSIELSGTARKDDRLASRLTTFFVGGYFFLKNVRSYEEWLRFEKDFWAHADRVIENLNHTSHRQ